jgi:hypothetical protein
MLCIAVRGHSDARPEDSGGFFGVHPLWLFTLQRGALLCKPLFAAVKSLFARMQTHPPTERPPGGGKQLGAGISQCRLVAGGEAGPGAGQWLGARSQEWWGACATGSMISAPFMSARDPKCVIAGQPLRTPGCIEQPTSGLEIIPLINVVSESGTLCAHTFPEGGE